jgi:ankyrin repeat protein
MTKNMRILFDQKIGFDIQDSDGNTPLHIASKKNRLECTELLLKQYNCSLDIKNKQGFSTPITGNWFP